MSEIIRLESRVFVLFVLHGICLLLCSDVLRSWANRRFSWTAVDRIGGFCFLVRGGTQDFCTDLSIPGWDPSAVYGGCHGTGNAAVSQDSQQMGSEGDFGSTLQNCQLVCVDI